MAHVSGILFDLTFKPDTPKSILDVFEFLGGLTKSTDEDYDQYMKLIEACPETFRQEIGTTSGLGATRKLSQWLFTYTTHEYAYMHGWNARRFDKQALRFESAASDRFLFDDQVIGILDALTPYLVLRDTGTICARELYESAEDEKAYWFDYASFSVSPGYYYKGGPDENELHPNYCSRPDGWAINEGFKPPMDYIELTKQGLHKPTNTAGFKPYGS